MSFKLTINGREVSAEKGQSILTLSREMLINIPALCHLKDSGELNLPSCMVCLVEITGRGLVPACGTMAEPDMEILTDTPRVREARRESLELLFLEHRGDCTAPCTLACPAGADIPGILRDIEAGQLERAEIKTVTALLFPTVLAAVCPAPCRKVCRRRNIDTALAIPETISALLTQRTGAVQEVSPNNRAGNETASVIVVGSGPAGLAAADTLARMNVKCLIMEENNFPGGGLAGALEKRGRSVADLNREIQNLVSDRISIRFGKRVAHYRDCTDASPDLRAIVIAAGSDCDNLFSVIKQTLPDDSSILLERTGKSAQTMAVMAVREGRRAAQRIMQALTPASPEHNPLLSRYGGLLDGEQELWKGKRESLTFPEHPDLLSVTEAGRCLSCDCTAADNCRLRDLGTEYGVVPGNRTLASSAIEWRNFGLLVYEKSKCIRCGRCVRQDPPDKQPAACFENRGVRTGITFALREGKAGKVGDISWAKTLSDICPTGALSINRYAEEKE
jgi:hypothetical protein